MLSTMRGAGGDGVVPRPLRATYSIAIGACGARGRWARALVVLRSMHEAAAADAAAKAQRSAERAAAAAADLGASMLGASMLGASMLGASSAEHAADGEEEEGREEDSGDGGAPKPDTDTFNEVIAACGAGGAWQRALTLLVAMRASVSASGGGGGDGGGGVLVPPPDSLTYSRVLVALDRNGARWEAALRVLEEMAEDGLPPDMVVHNHVVAACGHAGRWGAALHTLARARAASLRPNLRSYNAAIIACGRAGRWRRALAQLEEVRGARCASTDLWHATLLWHSQGGAQRGAA